MNKKGCKGGAGMVVTCTLREEIIFETYYKQQLLVPSLGFPPEPRRCCNTAAELKGMISHAAERRPNGVAVSKK